MALPKTKTLPRITLITLIYTDQEIAKIAEHCQKIQIADEHPKFIAGSGTHFRRSLAILDFGNCLICVYPW